MANGEWVYIDGVRLWQEWDDIDKQAAKEMDAKIRLNQLRPDDTQKHKPKQ